VLKQGSETHSTLRQSNLQQQNEAAALSEKTVKIRDVSVVPKSDF